MMDHDIREHRGGSIYRFWEEEQFKGAVQPACAVMSGGLTFRLPRIQDKTNLYRDTKGVLHFNQVVFPNGNTE